MTRIGGYILANCPHPRWMPETVKLTNRPGHVLRYERCEWCGESRPRKVKP